MEGAKRWVKKVCIDQEEGGVSGGGAKDKQGRVSKKEGRHVCLLLCYGGGLFALKKDENLTR
jgi:hypothetical protein